MSNTCIVKNLCKNKLIETTDSAEKNCDNNEKSQKEKWT